MGSTHELNGTVAGWPEVSLAASPIRALALAVGSCAFGLLGVAVALGWSGDVETWSKEWLAGWVGVVFFPMCGLLWLRQALTGGPVVTVGARGIRDTRISPAWIPWSAITGISETSVKGTHFLMLRIDPAFEATMPLTRMARWGKPANAALGYRGYGIAAVGLKGGFKALDQAIRDGLARTHAAHNPLDRTRDG
jgi:hypothetical protein